MRFGGIGRKGRGLWLAAVVLASSSTPLGASPVSDATSLYRQKKYAEARAILEPLTGSEPANAEAAYWLGMVFLRQGGAGGLDSARQWLGKSVRLAPENAGYLADYAGACLLMADRDNSFTLALEGRDAMTRAIAADPANIDACEGLMRFYAKAPWPLGSPVKALSLAARIASLNPKRGSAAYLSIAATFEKNGDKQDAISATQAAQSLARDHPH